MNRFASPFSLLCFGVLYLQFGWGAHLQNCDPSNERPVLNQIELPPVTGPLAVATKIYVWTDHSRHEKASNSQDFRQLVVQVWYPTEDVSGPTAPYVPLLRAYRRVWDDADVEVA